MIQTITFREVSLRAEKSGKCIICGKRRKRTKKFWQTINQWNKTPQGRYKTSFDIMPELKEDARKWKTEPINCCV